MRVRYTPEAFSDRERIFQYLLVPLTQRRAQCLGKHPRVT
jgi:plasmid stabilization system protein ParE